MTRRHLFKTAIGTTLALAAGLKPAPKPADNPVRGGDTITIGRTTYTFKHDPFPGSREIAIGDTWEASIENLDAAMRRDGIGHMSVLPNSKTITFVPFSPGA